MFLCFSDSLIEEEGENRLLYQSLSHQGVEHSGDAHHRDLSEGHAKDTVESASDEGQARLLCGLGKSLTFSHQAAKRHIVTGNKR